ncbi:hypothetical protein L3X38_025571 [Prunus dulcis]|uniref:Uncharacterized protein n=1 Tax=Prunus dulcis TaxID=3755 RepID=A0AAD4Z847_PRUDU|nr:hypothetical protein L3X38_025571 [Prunus dulcis]
MLPSDMTTSMGIQVASSFVIALDICLTSFRDAGTVRARNADQADYGPLNPANEAFWELTDFGVVRTPKLSELEAGAIPGWVTTLGSCSVSSQKQNRAGSEGGPKRTISCYGGAGPGCDRLNSEVKRVGGWSNPRMGDQPGKLLRELPETNPCRTLSSGPRADNIVLGVGSPQLGRGLLGAHWLRSCKNSEVKRVGGWSNPRMGDHPGKLLHELPETKPCGQ